MPKEIIEKPITSADDFFHWNADEKLKNTDFFVEATRREFDYIRERFFKQKPEEERLQWIQDTSGFGRQIGFVGNPKKGRSVFVQFYFWAIGGKYICFYNPTSRYCDWDMVEDYIKKFAPKYDNDTRIAMTDAGNFHNCYWQCEK